MNPDQSTYERIQAYLQGKMEEPEKKAFEEEMNESPELRNWVSLNREMFIQYGDTDWQELPMDPNREGFADLTAFFRSDEAKAFKEAMEKAKPTNVSPFRPSYVRILTLAAAVAALIWAVYWLIPAPGPDEEGAMAFITAPALELASRSDTAKLIFQAEQAYSKEEYAQAIGGFTGYLEEYPEDFEVRRALGYCQLATGRYAEALSTFRLISQSDHRERQDGEWYTAMVYLKQKDWDNCRRELNSILAVPGHRYTQKANDLLRKLPGGK